jgi:hypothetical protein
VVIDRHLLPGCDDRIPAIEQGQPESAWVAERMGRPVSKASNNIYFKILLENGRPKGTPDRIALPLAGDPAEAVAKVLRLVDELGFDAVDAGGIEQSWRQQPGTPCYARDLDAAKLKAALAAAVRSRVPEYRKAADDATKAFFRTEPIADGARGRVGTEKSFRRVGHTPRSTRASAAQNCVEIV